LTNLQRKDDRAMDQETEELEIEDVVGDYERLESRLKQSAHSKVLQ
jgi:hypothetical protein